MKKGYLSEYFEGVAIKRLVAVEVDTTVSHQHEFNATKPMLEFMGRPTVRTKLPTKFIYLCDEDDDPLVEDASLTLYDSRENQSRRSAEYRFYFPDTEVTKRAAVGDLLIIAKRRDAGLLVIIAEGESTAAAQVEWLFGFSDAITPKFSVRAELENDQDRIGFAAGFILESIGIVPDTTQPGFLDGLLERFPDGFPSTRQFSAYARSTLSDDVSAIDDPDGAVMAWMNREEVLFRTLERHLLGKRLQAGFGGADVDAFLRFSLSIQNRRKARAGLALENHVEYALTTLHIRFARTPVTENHSKPDFLFPSPTEYHNPKFSADGLTMLGVKSTCKDRWRQVLAEAARIPEKHLLTMEAPISVAQTDEMRGNRLQLVVPSALQDSYAPRQQAWLWSISRFVAFVRDKQARSWLPAAK